MRQSMVLARDPVFCAERKGCGMCAVPKSRYVAFSATARHEAWMLARFLPIAHRIPNIHRRGNVDGIDERIASSKGVNLWRGRQERKVEVDKQSPHHAPSASHLQAMDALTTEDDPTRMGMSCCD
ncbi:hypothetical protein HBH92_007610 [Parastagonospora nodorum]|nr:hypothetical protein HBH51_008530 [Parastagonospora nodorum]KAH4073500.1 hypothetical protein HBH50_054880 [Parastagonospora nodorum]KAH4099436.1 hypothetical protein HBH48_007240 [Parastagonospora nodorum]KAH4127716.1 hypothetical protein HBH47_037570 [Parastagonospora nodorum]KAH4179696.1 hypothetical protein HBH43_020720 [Parastagonospora nodorum]